MGVNGLESIGSGFVASPNARVKMEIHCYCFKPDPRTVLPTFWGYLIRIRSFDIKIGKLQIKYDDIPRDKWSQKRIQMMKKVRDEVIRRMGQLATE